MTNTQRTDEQPWTCRGCGVPISLDKGMNDVLSHKCHTPTDDSVVEKWENEYAEVFRLTCTHPVSNDFLKRNTIKFIRSLLTSQSIKHKAEVEKAGLLELVLLRTHLDRQLGGYSTVSVDSLYNYLDERQKHLTNKES